jgi:hypothetical protein
MKYTALHANLLAMTAMLCDISARYDGRIWQKVIDEHGKAHPESE